MHRHLGSRARRKVLPTAGDKPDPTSVLSDGTFDATALLVLWCIRKAFLPLLWIGLSVAVVLGQDIASLGESLQRELEGLDTPGELVSTLLSPFAGVIVAIVLRLAVGAAAFALAYPIARWNQPSDYPAGRRMGSYVRLWWDRVYLTRAYRAQRWTWSVRQSAARRLGTRGGLFELCNPILTWTNVTLFAVFLIIVALTS